MYKSYIIISILAILIILIIFYINNKKNQNNMFNVNILKKNENFGAIPLNLFQTWNTLNLPPKMKENVELLKKQNPEFTYYLYDDNMCREFIKRNFDKSVLYTFDKLKPGAYKADLFRYCILYINGGIYLDIKFICVPNFKLIYLTNTEYFVRDHNISNGTNGVYQALLICYPYNNILLKCINEIVENVKNNYWNYNNNDISNSLAITGPLLMSKYFYQSEINNFVLSFDILRNHINYKNFHILEIYKEYRQEQGLSNNNYYSKLYMERDIYNYINLENVNTYDFSRTITKNINGKDIVFYSGSPSILEHPTKENTYIVNIRWINYKINKYSGRLISLNSRFELNNNFEKISDELFFDYNYNIEIYFDGIEDVRLFNFNNNIYYIGSIYDNKRKVTSISCNIYDLDKTEIKKNIINPNFYDINNINRTEKNWALFNYNNDLAVIYSWYPLLICKIDFNDNLLKIIDIKYNIPPDFKEAKGSTPGYIFNNEIWFVLHKSQRNVINKIDYMNYQHFFVVFDLNMNLIRYSELFKFNNASVEFCMGLIIKNDKVILSYSIMDTATKISTYSLDYINNNLIWYNDKPNDLVK
jgi:mannosyltransferase OCH1-like enzyme